VAIIDELAKLNPINQQSVQQQPQEQQQSWVQDLISNRYSNRAAKVTKNPIGFQFNRNPFDPSSYYNQLNDYKSISKAATAVTLQEAANHQASVAAQLASSTQGAIGQAVGGITANFTYSNGGISRKYHLSRVSSNTAKAADYFGSMFGIRNIGGYSAHGSVPGSDHPKGRALDFMINNMKNGHSIGTALANRVIQNAKAWNVKYVIWNRYIWFPGRGWHKYSGPSPHTDHVHVSFNR
jgi:hypothetical protein